MTLQKNFILRRNENSCKQPLTLSSSLRLLLAHLNTLLKFYA